MPPDPEYGACVARHSGDNKEDRTTFARTEKGRVDLLGSSHALKQRQALFVINEAISVGELRKKLPSCPELESILDALWEDGYIDRSNPTPRRPMASTSAARCTSSAQAQRFETEVMARLEPH